MCVCFYIILHFVRHRLPEIGFYKMRNRRKSS